MTICRVLAEAKKGDLTITAEERTEKESAVPRYVIFLSKNERVIAHVPVAKTTWKKRFNTMVNS